MNKRNKMIIRVSTVSIFVIGVLAALLAEEMVETEFAALSILPQIGVLIALLFLMVWLQERSG